MGGSLYLIILDERGLLLRGRWNLLVEQGHRHGQRRHLVWRVSILRLLLLLVDARCIE